MPRIEDGLSDQQAFALIFETTSTRNLLGQGLWSLRNMASRVTMLDPVMTTLSIGVEKLMKMALGLLHVAEHGSWPPYNQFRYVWKHDLTLMGDELLGELGARLELATHRPVVEPMLRRVEEDPGWAPIIEALTRYGVEGRFYYLDQLADHPQPGERPDVLWDEAERSLIDADAGLRRMRDRAYAGTGADLDVFLRAVEARMAETLEGFWTLVEYAGIHGMLGERGQGWGHDVSARLVGRQIRG